MSNLRRNLIGFIIAGVSFVFVIGALVTALAETGYSPPKAETATDTTISIFTSTFTLNTPAISTNDPTATLEGKTPEPTPTKVTGASTETLADATSSPTVSTATAAATGTAVAVCTTPSGWTTYKVQSGDTLFSIAIRFQTNVTNLQIGNCMGSSTKIITGTNIWVPNNPTITPSKTTPPTVTTLVCYTLTLSHNGNGSNPTASPAKSDGCTTGKYAAGENVTLTALPSAGWNVGSWTGTDNDASTAKTNSLTMPASNHTVSVTYLAPTCYTLSLSLSGSGAAPSASIANSPGCTAGSYIAGENITLTAAPATGWTVFNWTGTNLDTSTSATNTVTMPASNHTASVVYLQCFTLTLTKTGTGADPTASPTNSSGCLVGSYIAGELITLTASGGTVTGWTGTDNDLSTATTNTLTMPASIHTASVSYTP